MITPREAGLWIAHMTRSLSTLACLAVISIACSGSNPSGEGLTNRPPRTAGDSSLAIAATPLVINVLSNDSDPDGDALAIVGVASPAHGTATPNEDGTITYTANAGYRGEDSFQYTVSDGSGGNATAWVALAVHTIANEVVWTPAAIPASPLLAIPDGARGVIAAWLELRSTAVDLRVYRPGHWTGGAVLVATMQGEPAISGGPLPAVQITPDGEGGAILAWSEYLTTEAATLSAQRIGADGTVRWAAGGVPVCVGGNSGPFSWRDFSLASDGAGGVVVAWVTAAVGGSFVAAQRLAASDGAPLWGVCGTRASPFTPAAVYEPRLVPDGADGVIVTSFRVAGGAIVAQRVDGGGNALWGDPGVLLLATNSSDYDVVADGAGGEIIVAKSGADSDIVAQRVNGSGALLWTSPGVTITAATGVQAYPALAVDGSGGAVIAWVDYRGHAYDAGSFFAPAMYAQRVTGGGTVAWTADGVLVCDQPVPLLMQVMQVVADGTGGAIVSWTDYRDGTYDPNIFAQRLGGDGAAAWSPDGIHVTDAPGSQSGAVASPDGAGGAVLVFVDWRTGTGRISSQRLGLDGALQ